MAHDVFISYATTDKTTADAVCANLESRGSRCWIAPRDILPGTLYGRAIVEAIQASRIMVVVFSSHSKTSPQVSREVERAVHHGLAIIPFRIEDVVPEGEMEFFLSSPHWLDAMTPPLERHLDQLATTVKLLLDRPRMQDANVVGFGATSRSEDESLIEPRTPVSRSTHAFLWSWQALAGVALALLASLLLFALHFVHGPQRTARASPPSGLVVTMLYGTAVRADPSSDAQIIAVAPCGARLLDPSADPKLGWYQVTWQGKRGWVGALRVSMVNDQNPPDCTGAVTLKPGEQVKTAVQNTCLSTTQSRTANSGECAPLGTRFTITNGPINGDDQDWFRVSSQSGADGWVPARSLVPAE
jgi:hypothetical protein